MDLIAFQNVVFLNPRVFVTWDLRLTNAFVLLVAQLDIFRWESLCA